MQPRRWPRSKKLEKGSNPVGWVKAKLFLLANFGAEGRRIMKSDKGKRQSALEDPG